MPFFDRPTAAELLAAVRDYLTSEVVPAAADRRARFRALIAANVLAVVERELARGGADDADDVQRLAALGYTGDPDAARRALCAEIRSGARDGDVATLAYARAATAAKLAVANPTFLAAFTPLPLED